MNEKFNVTHLRLKEEMFLSIFQCLKEKLQLDDLSKCD